MVCIVPKYVFFFTSMSKELIRIPPVGVETVHSSTEKENKQFLSKHNPTNKMSNVNLYSIVITNYH